jgi:hypothetical protein
MGWITYVRSKDERIHKLDSASNDINLDYFTTECDILLSKFNHLRIDTEREDWDPTRACLQCFIAPIKPVRTSEWEYKIVVHSSYSTISILEKALNDTSDGWEVLQVESKRGGEKHIYYRRRR